MSEVRRAEPFKRIQWIKTLLFFDLRFSVVAIHFIESWVSIKCVSEI